MRPTRFRLDGSPLFTADGAMLHGSELGIEGRAFRPGTVDFIEPGGNQIVAMLLEECFHGLDVKLAPGYTQARRELLRGLEHRIRNRDGGFHEASITLVIPNRHPAESGFVIGPEAA